MRYVRRSVEESMYSMAAVTPDYAESVRLSMFLYYITDLSVFLSGLYNVDGLGQAFVGDLHELLVYRRHLSNKERLIQVSMKAIVIHSDVYVAQVSALQWTHVRNTMANYL